MESVSHIKDFSQYQKSYKKNLKAIVKKVFVLMNRVRKELKTKMSSVYLVNLERKKGGTYTFIMTTLGGKIDTDDTSSFWK